MLTRGLEEASSPSGSHFIFAARETYKYAHNVRDLSRGRPPQFQLISSTVSQRDFAQLMLLLATGHTFPIPCTSKFRVLVHSWRSSVWIPSHSLWLTVDIHLPSLGLSSFAYTAPILPVLGLVDF